MLRSAVGKRSSRPDRGKSTRCHVTYAVARGWSTGLFYPDDLSRYKAAYEGFSSPCHQGFTAPEVEKGLHTDYLRRNASTTGQVSKVRSRRPRSPSPEDSVSDDQEEQKPTRAALDAADAEAQPPLRPPASQPECPQPPAL